MSSMLALVGAVVAVAQAQPAFPYVTPSPAALALAQAADDRPPSPVMLQQAAEGIETMLLSTIGVARGLPCDPALPACRAAAERIGADAAPAAVKARRDERARLLALVVDETMTPAEIVQAAPFVRTPGGKAFARSLMLLGDIGTMPPELMRKVGMAAMEPANKFDSAPLFERFYAATKSLPRRPQPVAPPPPPQFKVKTP